MPVRQYWTLAQIRAKIKKDLDLEDEQFITSDELIDYINEAIDEAEAEIHTLYEDYFLDRAQVTLVVDQEEYDLPANIYAHKIRRVLYNNGGTVYTVLRIRDWKKFEEQAIAQNFAQSDLYQYFIINETAGTPKILLVPKSREDGTVMTVWYLRQANRLEVDTDICDIPDFINFVFQYVKVRVYEKEGHPNMDMALAALEKQRELMNGVLAAMVPDGENELEMDTSHYEESN